MEEVKEFELVSLVGEDKVRYFNELCMLINSEYEMDKTWTRLKKTWDFEYKFRRGGKTLCTFYIRKDCIGFMLIFGKAERDKFELNRENYSSEIQKTYDESKTFHDGKWMMFYLENTSLFNNFLSLLEIKRKPNKKNS